jgi:hypothetical protein
MSSAVNVATKKRWVWVGLIAAAVVLAAGGVYYTRGQPVAEPPRPRDPGLTVLFAIRTVERTDETRLSKEQIAKILPFVKALKDVPASDDAGVIIARAIRDTFTVEQKAVLETARQQFQSRGRQPQQRAAPGGVGGGEGEGPGAGPAGAGGPGGAGGSDEQRAQVRARAFERMILYLERRMK